MSMCMLEMCDTSLPPNGKRFVKDLYLIGLKKNKCLYKLSIAKLSEIK